MTAPAGAAGAAPASHPAFGRSVAVFARLGTAVRVSGVPSGDGLPDAHPTYRAVTAALRAADAGAAPLLEDASLLDRAAYELGLFSRLLRAAMAGDAVAEPGPAAVAFATAPSVRLLRTRWDWEAFLGDPVQAEPREHDAAWVLYLPPSGPVQVRRLHPLPALLLEAGARPLTRDAAVAVVAEQVEGDRARIAAMVHAQLDELRASGLLRVFAPTAADHAVAEMRRLLLAEEIQQPAARTLVGLLARAIRPAREYAEEALRATDAPYPVHRLDDSAALLDRLLVRARLRDAFSRELDGYWASAEVPARAASLAPLLDVLGRALGHGVHALPPYVMAP